MKTFPRGFARRHVWRQFIFTFAAIVALFHSAFALSTAVVTTTGRTDQESPPSAPAVNGREGLRNQDIYSVETIEIAHEGLKFGIALDNPTDPDHDDLRYVKIHPLLRSTAGG